MNTLASIWKAPTAGLDKGEALASPIVWWVVLIIVLLALAATLTVAMSIWCASHGGGLVISWQLHWPYVTIGCSQ